MSHFSNVQLPIFVLTQANKDMVKSMAIQNYIPRSLLGYRLSVVLMAVITLGALSGCDSVDQKDDDTSGTSLHIAGKITSSVDSAPIAGATIELISEIGFVFLPFGDPTLLTSSKSNGEGEYNLAYVLKQGAESNLALGVGLQAYKTTVVLSSGSDFDLGETESAIITTNDGAYVRCHDARQTINVVLKSLDD